MPASITPDTHDDNWTAEFITEIEQCVQERYEREILSPSVEKVAPLALAEGLARASANSVNLSY